MDWIRPEFGALLGPTKSIRAGENLFARNSALLRFASFATVGTPMLGDVGDQTKASGSNPSACMVSLAGIFCPALSLQPHDGAERIVDFEIDEIIDNAHGFALQARVSSVLALQSKVMMTRNLALRMSRYAGVVERTFR
jgi:hypothetical protein